MKEERLSGGSQHRRSGDPSRQEQTQELRSGRELDCDWLILYVMVYGVHRVQPLMVPACVPHKPDSLGQVDWYISRMMYLCLSTHPQRNGVGHHCAWAVPQKGTDCTSVTSRAKIHVIHFLNDSRVTCPATCVPRKLISARRASRQPSTATAGRKQRKWPSSWQCSSGWTRSRRTADVSSPASQTPHDLSY